MTKDEEAKKLLHKDTKWFVERYKNNDTSNKAFIENFQRYLEGRRTTKNTKQHWVVPIYQNIPIDEIIRYLREEYAN